MAATSYENFQDARTNAQNRWETRFVKPYGIAYNEAYLSFNETIKEQEEADKAAREAAMQFALFALSLCGGSILTQVFGSAVLKEVAAKVAVDTVCNYGMERAFKVAAFVERNKTAQFALGELWGKAEGWIGDKLKNKINGQQNKIKKSSELEELASNYQGIASFGKDPLTVQNSLSIWVGELYDIVLNTGNVINNQFDGDAKIHLLNALTSSLFITSAPEIRLDEGQVRKDIELTFFMKHVLDMDYHVKGKVTMGNKYQPVIHKPVSKTSIQTSPIRADYPHYKSSGREFPTGAGYDYQDVEYQQIGDIIRKRINDLHKEKFGSDFFQPNEKISRNTLVRAEITLGKLEERNLNTLQKSVATFKHAIPTIK